MTTSASARASSIQKFVWAKKTVLLVDINSETREARARMLRSLGVTVHCAANSRSARSRYDSGAYNLVLVDLGPDAAAAEQLAAEMKQARPRQLVAFLVGRPFYLASSLGSAGAKTRGGPARIQDRVRTLQAPTAGSMDFGQKIRDAETAQQKTA
jgi:CheY-like chemotaxis protein